MRWNLVLVLGFGLLSLYAANTVLGTLVPTISHQLSLGPLESGAILGAYGYSYAAMQLPVGYLADREEPRRIFTVSLFALFFTTIFFSLSTSFLELLASRIAMGAAASFLYVDGLKTIEITYDREERGRAMGVFTGLAYGGITSSNLIAAFLLESTNYGWRLIYQGTSFAVLLGALLGFGYIPSRLLKKTNVSPSGIAKNEYGLPTIAFRDQLLTVYRNKFFWIQTMMSFVVFGSMFALIYWFPTYFISKGFAAAYGGIAAALIGVGSALGAILFGFLADSRGKRLPLIRASFISYAILLVLIAYVFSSPAFLIAALGVSFALGVSQGGLTPNTRVIAELFPKEIVGTAFGIFNAVSWLGSATFPLLVGAFLGAGLGFNDAFLVIIVLILLMLIATIFSFETGKSKNSKSVNTV
jgi:ACS family D-galactonate transporter-like MFS transporter